MTDMKFSTCVPLPGPGMVARYGDLVAVTDGQADGPDPLLGALEEVAAGDGAALVLAAARAVLAYPRQFSGACAGVTAGGEVAVLVHGGATVAVGVDGAPEVELTASGSILPVNRTFAGTTITIRVLTGGPVTPDPRLRLDGGVVYGGGLVLTATSAVDVAEAGMIMSGAPAADVMMSQVPSAGGARMPDAPQAAGPPSSDAPQSPDTMMPDAAPAGDMPFNLPADPTVEAPRLQELWFTAQQDVDPGQGDARRPPASVVPSSAAAAPGREPQLHQPDPAADFEYVSFLSPGGEPDQHDHDPHGQPVEVDIPPAGTEGTDPYAADPALVDGVLCARNHFNDPNVQYCRQCGISMVQLTQRIQKGPRPPLGVLLLDDGTGFTLDKDYIVGREPVLDGDVAAGRARPLRIPDPGGTVSRLHLRISLIGWQVEVRDLNSSNGSVLNLPNGAERKLAPGDSAVIEPGTKIGVGHRSIQYQSYRAG